MDLSGRFHGRTCVFPMLGLGRGSLGRDELQQAVSVVRLQVWVSRGKLASHSLKRRGSGPDKAAVRKDALRRVKERHGSLGGCWAR